MLLRCGLEMKGEPVCSEFKSGDWGEIACARVSCVVVVELSFFLDSQIIVDLPLMLLSAEGWKDGLGCSRKQASLFHFLNE
jgi:hypothetical protein